MRNYLSLRSWFLKFLLAFFFAASVACAQSDGLSGASKAYNLVIESGDTKHRFTVELAASPEERQIGLMHRTELAPDGGMIFDFGDEPILIAMWMKNTLIPLDMAFLDEDGKIINIAENTTPMSLESIPSNGPAVGVLEVSGGTFARLGIKAGDQIRHEMFKNN